MRTRPNSYVAFLSSGTTTVTGAVATARNVRGSVLFVFGLVVSAILFVIRLLLGVLRASRLARA